MVTLIEIFFRFDDKIVMSATPYRFSDPRFKALHEYKITFHEDFLGEVLVINSPSVQQSIDHFIENQDKASGNIHIFYNSVTEIAEVIKRNNLTNCNVFCADEVKNKKTLGVAYQFFKPRPITGEYKKINFYTTRYFEGWSLRDIKPTIILVTDVYKRHTKTGITNKGVQAIGRVRIDKNNPDSKPEGVYHITNHRKNLEFKSLEEFSEDYNVQAEYLIMEYNKLYLEYCATKDIEPLKEKKDIVLKYAVISEEGKAKVNHTKIDQIVNEDSCNEEFNHISYIHNAWNSAGFRTIELYYYKARPIKENAQRITKKMLKSIYEEFKVLEPQRGYRFFLGDEDLDFKTLEEYKIKYPILYEAYKILPESEVIRVDYKLRELEKLLILANNKDTDIAIKKLLDKYFTVGQRYTIDEINNKLQEVYNYVGRKEKPNATHLKNNNWYEIKSCKISDKKYPDRIHNGYIIQRKTFDMKVTTE